LLQNGTFDKPIRRIEQSEVSPNLIAAYVTVKNTKARDTMARASEGGLSVAATLRHDKIT
jgi:hypothetical protein